MSQENVEIVRSLHRAFESGDRDALQPRFHPDVEWDVTSSGLPGASVYRGHAGVRDFFRDWLGPWDDFGTETLELIGAGDSVVIVFRQWGRGRESGVPVDRHFFGVYDLAEGLIVRLRLFESRDQALAAAGLDVG